MELNVNDTVFATVIVGGIAVVSRRMIGHSSVGELLKDLVAQLDNITGLVVIELRNSTMGWRMRRPMKLRRAIC